MQSVLKHNKILFLDLLSTCEWYPLYELFLREMFLIFKLQIINLPRYNMHRHVSSGPHEAGGSSKPGNMGHR